MCDKQRKKPSRKVELFPLDSDSVLGFLLAARKRALPFIVSLLRRCSNNLNQIARRANETGRVYQVDVDSVMQMQQKLWKGVNQLLTRLGSLS